jgi:hypothetical protein
MMFDLTNENTLFHIRDKLINDVKEKNKNSLLYLIGNKLDLE